MDVCLVRHAAAGDRDPERWPDDALRPLTKTGAEEFRRVARRLRTVATPEAVLSSPYTRAWQTAELLRDEGGWPAPERSDVLAPESAPSAAVEALARADAAVVALVGHDPHLSELASLLLSGDRSRVDIRIKKGGALLLRFRGPVTPGAAELRWAATPKLLQT